MRGSIRTMLGGAMLALAAALAVTAAAAEAINTTDGNIAILGYDPVAYFTQSAPVKGNPLFETTWQGARWQFANDQHRALFAADPDRYAPRYGGFCAGAMSAGWRAPIDPEAWVIVEDRLYLAYSKNFVGDVAADADGGAARIARADANWERLGKVE